MITPYIRAAFPALALETVEEERFCQYLLTEFPDKQILSIAACGGLRNLRTGGVVDDKATFATAFQYVAQRPDHLLVVLDWQHVARNAVAYRALKDAYPQLKAHGSCLLLLAPAWSLPPELRRDLPILEWRLPSRYELQTALDMVAQSVGDMLTPEQITACLDAAAGLTLQEAENAYALTLVERNTLDPTRVAEEKMRLIRTSGYLEVWPAVDPASVGGLESLKDYFAAEVLPCRDDADLRVRGVLLVGIPGTGKSLASKAAGALLGWPVLRLDIGALKGSLVGQSESNMRAALKLAEAVAPCVLWIDELEKGVGGYQSSAHSDSGVTLGMVGAYLTWQQEHTSPILTVATCNDYGKLPPELTRAGRFDERFFVDLPTRAERRLIAAIHLRRFSVVPEGAPQGVLANVNALQQPLSSSSSSSSSSPSSTLTEDIIHALAEQVAALTEGWTGAEIEQLIKSAARRSQRRLNRAILAVCAEDIKPISTVRAEETQTLRDWARSTLRLANTPEAAGTAPPVKHPVKRGGRFDIGGISMN